MNYLKKIGRILLITFLSIFVLSFLLNLLYYFDIISSNMYNIMKMLIVLVSLFMSAFFLGKSSLKYGIVEGLKLGAIFILIMIIIKSITNSSYDIRTIIYSIIILLTTSVASIIGINVKEKK